MTINRLAPKAEGGVKSRRSRRVRLSRPIDIDRCWSIGSSNSGALSGSGGISWEARCGKTGAGDAGGSTRRYQGIEESETDSDGEGVGDEVEGVDSADVDVEIVFSSPSTSSNCWL